MSYLCNRNRETNKVLKDAQMAESVDALVSNTSGFTSIPVRPRVWVLKRRKLKNSLRFSFMSLVTRWFADSTNFLLNC